MTTDAAADTRSRSKAKVFISYSRKDMAFADQLETALKGRGFETLIDRSDIYAFEEWWKRIEALIGRADTVVFVLSPDAVRPDSVARKEVAYAASLNKRFAPIVFRPIEDKSVPDELAKLNFIFFNDPSHFEASADKLSDALHTDIGWIRQHTEYGEAERRWSTVDRPSGLLLRSPTLELAEHWMASRPRGAPEPTPEIQTFVAESRRGARSAQRLRRLVSASMFALLVAIIFGLVGWINQEVVKNQINWYITMRPYMLSNFRPFVLMAEKEATLKAGQVFRECLRDCPEMVIIPAGKFLMGTSINEKGRSDNEGPQHEVTFARPFAIAKFPVTFSEWDACASVGGCPDIGDSGFGRGARPVINVNWYEAKQYVAWLAKMTGKAYRLPTEAEWEYSARAGTTTAYFWGDEIGRGNANCMGCGTKWDARETAPVGSFKPNDFSLHDVHGNTWQWLEDCYESNYEGAPSDGSARITTNCERHVVRGGYWYNLPDVLRSGFRSGDTSRYRDSGHGLRVARSLKP